MENTTNTRIKGILDEAEEILLGDRAEAYGDAVENHERIAAIYNAVTGSSITARDVAIMHVATKLSRMRLNNAHRDSHVDAAAYIAIAFACADVDVGTAANRMYLAGDDLSVLYTTHDDL